MERVPHDVLGAPKGAAAGQLLAETCVVSAAFLDGLRQSGLALARGAAKEALAARRESPAAASTSGQADGVLLNHTYAD